MLSTVINTCSQQKAFPRQHPQCKDPKNTSIHFSRQKPTSKKKLTLNKMFAYLFKVLLLYLWKFLKGRLEITAQFFFS